MKTKTDKFEAVLSKLSGWIGVHEILRRCDKAGAFEEFAPDELITMAKLSLIRQKLRAHGKADPGAIEQANEWVSILVQDRSGRAERKYKQLALFDLQDYVQVVRDRSRRMKYFRDEIQRFVDLAVQKFGNKAQGVFSFTDSSN